MVWQDNVLLRDSQALIASSKDMKAHIFTDGKFTEAREEIQQATAMTKNLRKQELLADRLEAD
jgi:hypothetical protein